MTGRALTAAMALVVAAGSAWGQSRVATNLVTHSEVTIDRPAAAIWPEIVDPSRWKLGAKLWHHAGPAGQVGEVFAAGDPANRAAVAFYVENVELEPNGRRTIKLFAPAGTLLGYASWALRQTGGRTVVTYDVYAETLLGPEQAKGMTPDQLRAAERSERATNQKRFDDELLGLKRLVEGRGK